VVLIALMLWSPRAGTWAAGAPPTPDDKAVVVGGIAPCEGIPVHGGPRYAAGTVTVLKGRVTWKRIDGQSRRPVFPTHVVADARVATNGMYRFILAPGHYVLRARYQQPANVHPYVQVALKPGRVVHVDIPNICR